MDDTAAARLSALASKAGLIWVDTGASSQPLWFGWHDGAIHAVVDGPEQPSPFGQLPGPVQVTVPSKDSGAAVLRVPMIATPLSPGTAAWLAASAALASDRLNGSTDPAERWATESTLVRLDPAGPPVEPALDGGLHAVSVESVRPRGWRPMRAHLRARRQA